MKISRSTRKSLIIVLSIILIILIGILCYIVINDRKQLASSYEVNVDKLATGVEEIKTVDNPFTEEDIAPTQEEIVTIEKEETVTEEPQLAVYNNMTLEEIATQLDKSFNDDLSGKGYLYASYSIERGVDPYLAAAISLEETGCTWGCSYLVKACNNVGGMKGAGCGSYGYFPTLDDGIKAFIDNISNNYVAYGLTTANLMNPKYAENPNWSTNVNAYIERIKNK